MSKVNIRSFSLLIRRHTISTLFPYTTLFRSLGAPEASPALFPPENPWSDRAPVVMEDRKSTRLNSSHEWSSYAVFCLKKKKMSKGKKRSGARPGRPQPLPGTHGKRQGAPLLY